jgi:glyoxylase-like metal-dependent hydrolase (beta-lactamase superfamily II)
MRYAKAGVLMGGCSSEREISMRSGRAVVSGLRESGHMVTPVILSRESVDGQLAGLEAVHTDFGEPFRPKDIRRIIITHGHVDHIGGLPELFQTTRAQVAIHPLERMAVAKHEEYMTVGNARLKRFLIQAGVDPARRAAMLKISHYVGVPVEGVPIELTLADGDELDGLRIIHTPGHAPGHVCIGVGNVLLSADHVLARTIPQQWPESTAAYTGLGHYFESLDKIQRTAGFELTLAAHEQAIHDVYGRIDTIRAAHRRRLDRLVEMLRKLRKPMSIDEITAHLYPEATGFRAMLAITDVGSRVEYLHRLRLAVKMNCAF